MNSKASDVSEGVEQVLERLRDAARWSNMPASEQIRFESMLSQLGGERPRKDPLPVPMRHGGSNG